MMRVTLFLVTLAACMAVANAACGTVYSDNTCETAVETTCAGNDACVAEEQGSSKVVCANDTSASSWTLNSYTSTDCTGTAIPIATGTDSMDCALIGGGAWILLDCAASCFSVDSFVTLQGGNKVHLHEVNVGDKVLATDDEGNLFFDRVFRITHWDHVQTANYIRMTTESGKAIEATTGHYVHANSCCSLDNMVLAGNVKVGDELYTVNEQGELVPDAVVSVERVQKQGAFNVHTLSGHIVVDGVAASHFSYESTWETKSYAPLWYKALDLASPLIGVEDAKNQA